MKYPFSFGSKLPKVETTIFTVMSALANEHNALNLSQGFPEFDGGDVLRRLVNKAMKEGHNHYAPMAGHMPLREKIAEKMEREYSAVYHPEKEITITAGGTEAIFSAITSMIREGDEVILFAPAYDCYAPAIELNGGKTVFVELNTGDYSINWEKVKRVMNYRTKMIIINTPHNPTGSIMNAQDMERLSKLVKGTEIMVLSDEVYEHIIYEGYEHQSVARFPELAERSFIVYSMGKTFHNTGWRLGYCLAPENLMSEFRKVHQYSVFTCNTPMQHAFAEVIADPGVYGGIAPMFQEKRDAFRSMLKGSKLKVLPCDGTYFQLIDYSAVSDEGDVDFAKRLTIDHGLASIPISVFYPNLTDNKVLRFCFAKETDTLQRATNILNQIGG